MPVALALLLLLLPLLLLPLLLASLSFTSARAMSAGRASKSAARSLGIAARTCQPQTAIQQQRWAAIGISRQEH